MASLLVPWSLRTLFQLLPHLKEAWEDPLLQFALERRSFWRDWNRRGVPLILFACIWAMAWCFNKQFGSYETIWVTIFSYLVFLIARRKLMKFRRRRSRFREILWLPEAIAETENWHRDIWKLIPMTARRASGLIAIYPQLVGVGFGLGIFIRLLYLLFFLWTLVFWWVPWTQTLITPNSLSRIVILAVLGTLVISPQYLLFRIRASINSIERIEHLLCLQSSDARFQSMLVKELPKPFLLLSGSAILDILGAAAWAVFFIAGLILPWSDFASVELLWVVAPLACLYIWSLHKRRSMLDDAVFCYQSAERGFLRFWMKWWLEIPSNLVDNPRATRL